MRWFHIILLIVVIVYAEEEKECPAAKPCAPGVILPVWTPQDDLSLFTKIFRAFVYLIALCYFFFGVSIVADRFMAAIEVITAQKKEVKLRKITGEPYSVYIQVWNETVSNLTLMALGSSAPEILLSVIEIFGNNFEAGDLGPSTIVGSAAFNLFIIIAICISTIPSGETRRVQHNNVFWVTVIWSTFAYIWLYLILCYFSPNEVEVWEGLLTFIFFPLTVISAYIADRYTGSMGQRLMAGPWTSFFGRRTPRSGRSPTKKRHDNNDMENGKEDHKDSLLNVQDADAIAFEEHRKKFMESFKQLRTDHPDAPVEELEKLATEMVVNQTKKSRAFYRIQATRKLVGSGDIIKKNLKKGEHEHLVKKEKSIIVGFDPAHYMCLESVGKQPVKVKIDRGDADPQSVVTVHYRTVADTAQEHSDFVPTEGILTFNPGETEKTIEIEIVDNDIYEDDEQFLVRLSQVRAHNISHLSAVPCRLGAASTATVLIVDDDHAGAFGFSTEKFKVVENAGEFVGIVMRTRGARGEVSIPYQTIEGSAKDGKDFRHQKGVLKFKNEQTQAEIHVPIIHDNEYEKTEEFFIELGEPIWHADQKDQEEGADGKPVLSLGKCRVIITEDKEFKNLVERVYANANATMSVGTDSWKQQFQDALTVSAEEEDEEITIKDKIMHYIALPWKLLFALIPPTTYCHGWICFFVSIFMIGVLTAVIGDLASHFGCTVGLKDTVTAVSLVAMGTSIPDTFASRTAAVQDEYADSSIGNVTGSNAVNVFLGIGIAWAIAACYHAYNGTKFIVQSGSLGFSVCTFIIGSAVCIVVLQLRRFNKNIKAELGGPVSAKYLSSAIFFGLWIVYLILAALQAYCIIDGF